METCLSWKCNHCHLLNYCNTIQCVACFRLKHNKIGDRFIKTYTPSKVIVNERYKMIPFKNKLYLISVSAKNEIKLQYYDDLEENEKNKQLLNCNKYISDDMGAVGYYIDDKNKILYIVTQCKFKGYQYELTLIIYDLNKMEKQKQFRLRPKGYHDNILSHHHQIIVLPAKHSYNKAITERISFKIINYWQQNIVDIIIPINDICNIIDNYYCDINGYIDIILLKYSSDCGGWRADSVYYAAAAWWCLWHGTINLNDTPFQDKSANSPDTNFLNMEILLSDKIIRMDETPSNFEYILSFCKKSKLYLIFNKLNVEIDLMKKRDIEDNSYEYLRDIDNYKILYEEKQKRSKRYVSMQQDSEYSLSEKFRFKFNRFDAYNPNKKYLHLIKRTNHRNACYIELFVFDKHNLKIIPMNKTFVWKYDGEKENVFNDLVYNDGYLHIDTTFGYFPNLHYKIQISSF